MVIAPQLDVQPVDGVIVVDAEVAADTREPEALEHLLTAASRNPETLTFYVDAQTFPSLEHALTWVRAADAYYRVHRGLARTPFVVFYLTDALAEKEAVREAGAVYTAHRPAAFLELLRQGGDGRGEAARAARPRRCAPRTAAEIRAAAPRRPMPVEALVQYIAGTGTDR